MRKTVITKLRSQRRKLTVCALGHFQIVLAVKRKTTTRNPTKQNEQDGCDTPPGKFRHVIPPRSRAGAKAVASQKSEVVYARQQVAETWRRMATSLAA
jgi:hypothetical protein